MFLPGRGVGGMLLVPMKVRHWGGGGGGGLGASLPEPMYLMAPYEDDELNELLLVGEPAAAPKPSRQAD